ncbi:MAG: CaiB/BaiF CoA transferase family protein [Halobacteriota archaeon]
MSDSDLPLSGITVIDCSSVYAGPMAAQVLGDFGAEVIKIEHPEFGDSVRAHGEYTEPLAYKWLNRNKKSIGVDLHEPAGQAIVEELVEDADVFIENFRPGTLERWNVGWDTLSEINPDLVMVRVTGFGQTGPYNGRPGFGTLAEAMSGFAYVTGLEDGPPTLPSMGLADFTCAIFSAYSAMLALYWRDVGGGSGQCIDMSLLEPLFSFMGAHAVDYAQKGIVHERNGNRTHSSSPRNTYQTKDGHWLAVAGATEGTARRIMRVVGGDDILEDPRFATMDARIEHDEAVDDLVQSWIGERTREEVMELFEEADAPAAPVYSIEGIINDPQLQARGTMTSTWDEEFDQEFEMPGVIPKFSETPGRIDSPGPALGQHTREILAERTSLDDDGISELAADGVVATDE